MENFELIDDYLANRLNEQDRQAFEQQLEGDPALKEEVEFQQQVVQGVRHARVAELKSMLNNVPVSGNYWSGGKIAAAVVTVGIVATGLYFYMNENEDSMTSLQEQNQEITEQSTDKTIVPIVPSTSDVRQEDSVTTQQPTKEKLEKLKENKSSTPVSKPNIQVVDPSADFSQTEEGKESVTPGQTQISPSKMEVAIGPVDKKHNFHYQFVQDKLMLYGPFDKNLYEILEIHGDGHAVFLFYKENYYLLDEKQSAITKLVPISDGQLLKKLREYRSQ